MKAILGARVLGVLACVTAYGCAGGGGTETAPVDLSVRVAGAAVSFAPDPCGNTLSRARLLFRRLRVDGDCPAGATSGCEVEAEVGPFLIDLAGSDFDGVFQQGVLTAQLPLGDYDRARFDLHKTDAGDAGGDASLQQMIADQLSVSIEGTTAAAVAFTFESDLNDEQEKAIALVVGDAVTGVDGITLTVDPATWFGDATACLDPMADHDVIEDRIRSGIDLDEDDDQDGESD